VCTFEDDEKDIFMYDLLEDSNLDGTPNFMESVVPSPDPAQKRVTNLSEPQIMLPVIYADKIVWQDTRNASKPADSDIYIFTLTENKAPVINYPIPNYNPEIEEGESITFMIVAEDPEGLSLNYSWYLDEEQIPDNDTFILDFVSEHGMAGYHEIKVIISDGETSLDKIWVLYIAESGIEPLEIIWVEPGINPIILEGEEITLKLRAGYLGSKEISTAWEFQEWNPPPPKLIQKDESFGIDDNGIYMDAIFESQLDYNGSNFQKVQKVTAKITDGLNTVTHTWIITVLFLDDTDFDGYSDNLEIDWNSDPHIALHNPPDLDYDLVVDIEDDDIDGDGFLGKYDSDDTDFSKQVDQNPDIMPEILILLISAILLLIAIISYSKIQRS
jgi:hypothetical protein